MALTVKDLLNECKIAVANGHGNKEVWISRDDEGNGYHGLYYSFLTDKEAIEEIQDMGLCDYGCPDADKIVILG